MTCWLEGRQSSAALQSNVSPEGLGHTTGQTNRHQEGQPGRSLQACVVLYCTWLDARRRRISMG
jgi:hypothetical protein